MGEQRRGRGTRGQHLRQWRENWFTLDGLVITEGEKMTWIEQWRAGWARARSHARAAAQEARRRAVFSTFFIFAALCVCVRAVFRYQITTLTQSSAASLLAC